MYKQYFIDVGEGDRAGKIAVYEQEGQPKHHDNPILMCHATGFHARCWDEVVRQLPERRIILLDTACHGLSSNLEPPFSWHDFTLDLIEVIETLNLQNIIGVGHSMGGHLIIRAAGNLSERFASILAIDPVITDANMSRMRDLIPEGFEHPVAKRRNNWTSSDEMYASFKAKNPFKQWHPQVLKDYCDYGLIETEGSEKSLKLACPPRLEANIYLTPDSEGAYQVIPKITCPVTIVRARARTADDLPFDFGPSPTNPELVNYFSEARKTKDIQLHNNSHFIPMEIPHTVADMIRELDCRERD